MNRIVSKIRLSYRGNTALFQCALYPWAMLSRKEKSSRGKGVVTVDDIPVWDSYYEKELGYKYSKYTRKFAKAHGTVPEVEAAMAPKLNSKISLWQGDITSLQIDAIVNAVDGCIHARAGPGLREECSRLNGCSTGEAKITKGHRLPAEHVIHTVGPIGEKPEALKSCYNSCLKIVEDEKIKTVAFCCISTGIYGYPNESAAHVALKTTREWLENSEYASKVERIIFCVFLPLDLDIYEQTIPLYFPSQVTGEVHDKVMHEMKEKKTKSTAESPSQRKEKSKQDVNMDEISTASEEKGNGTEKDKDHPAVKEDSPAVKGEGTPAAMEEDSPAAMEEDSPAAMEEDTPAAMEEDTPAAMEEDSPAAMEQDSPAAMKEDSSAAKKEDSSAAEKEDSPAAKGEDSPAAKGEDSPAAKGEDSPAAMEEDSPAAMEEDSSAAKKEDSSAAKKEDSSAAKEEGNKKERQETFV